MADIRITEKSKDVSITDLATQLMSGPEFTFEYQLQATNPKFPWLKGKFQLRFPTIEDELTASRLQAQLRGYATPTAFDYYQNAIFEAIAWLKTVTVGAPQWFVKTYPNGDHEAMPEQMVDLEAALTIYQKWREWEKSFRTRSNDQSGGDQEGSTPQTSGTE
jgi:hypothetical protein